MHPLRQEFIDHYKEFNKDKEFLKVNEVDQEDQKEIKELSKFLENEYVQLMELENGKLYGQKENEELEESYKESVRQTKERQDKGHLDSFSDDLKNSIEKKINKGKK